MSIVSCSKPENIMISICRTLRLSRNVGNVTQSKYVFADNRKIERKVLSTTFHIFFLKLFKS